MERRYAVRKKALLAECEVRPEVFADWERRLGEFVEPFAELLNQEKQQDHATTYLLGLLSNVQRKNVESIAYEHDQDRKNLQHFIGQADWDDAPLRGELARQVGHELGEADGVLVFDPSSFPKKGRESVGVDRQWSGRLGKLDNCQVGVYLAYVARREHVLVDVRLYLSEEWAKDKKRRKKAGVPKEVRFATRHTLALQMLDEYGVALPHRWITGDDEMGRSSGFRRDLRGREEQYLLMVPSNTTVRDLDSPAPDYRGSGRPPKQPFQRVYRWADACPRASGRNSTYATVRKVRSSSRRRVVACWPAPNAASPPMRRLYWCSARSKTTEPGSETMRCPTHWPRRHWWNSRESSRPSIESRSVFSAARARRVWATTKSATGAAGIIIRRCR